MKATLPQTASLGDGRHLGFVAVVVAAYISALSYSQSLLTMKNAAALIPASIAYLVVGVYGFAYCQRVGKTSVAAIYFFIQLALAVTIMYVGYAGLIMLIMLPLVGQSVVLLSRRQTLLMCALILVIMASPVMMRGGWEPALRVSLFYLAGIVFVVVFTQTAVNERKTRAEVERLAGELGEAYGKLRDYAAKVEDLATIKERNRLAREIHDSLGHYLTVVNVQIEAARAVLDSDRPRALDGLRKAQLLTQEGLAEVRRSVASLRASPTESRPLPEALAELVDECRAAGIDAELTVNNDPRALTPQAELTLYRAAQEGLTNVRKHARASRARVTLEYGTDRLTRLVVEDNGVGGNETNGGFGLLGVRERAQLLGGEVRVSSSSATGQGFRLEVELPE
jgi:signal transduction histidine kinase